MGSNVVSSVTSKKQIEIYTIPGLIHGLQTLVLTKKEFETPENYDKELLRMYTTPTEIYDISCVLSPYRNRTHQGRNPY